jgi:hypothetical protein
MGKFKQYAYALLATILFSCGSKQDRVEQVLALKEMGNLATTEYTVTKIVKANDNKTWYKLGDRKILISVEATLKAGIDLTSITADNISIDGKKISISLPPPKLLSLKLPPEKIKVEYEEVGMLRNEFSNSERDALLAQGENQIRNSVKELGLLETTEKNTRAFITEFLKKLGYEDIRVSFTGEPLIKQDKE